MPDIAEFTVIVGSVFTTRPHRWAPALFTFLFSSVIIRIFLENYFKFQKAFKNFMNITIIWNTISSKLAFLCLQETYCESHSVCDRRIPGIFSGIIVSLSTCCRFCWPILRHCPTSGINESDRQSCSAVHCCKI